MKMASHEVKGKTIHTAAKEIVCRVIDVCDEEARTGELRIPLTKRQTRVSDYTAISVRTIKKIKAESIKAGGSKLRTPGKQRPWGMSRVAQLDYFGVHVVRNTINDFYLFHKGELNVSKLLGTVKEKIDFPGGQHTLRNLLRDMGFKWKRCKKRKYQILMEHPHITMWRFRYLESIRKAREENKDIIYLSETWVDNNLAFKKCWYNGDRICVQASINRSKRLIIFNACKETGFIENVQFFFKANGAAGDGNSHLYYQTYEKWLTEKLLPNIPENSVIIFDSSPYNSAERNKIPSKYATKASMISWLEKNDVPVSPHMYKSELYSLITKYKTNEKVYCIDELLKSEGHTVLRLPPYMNDLNPTELVWEKVESKIRQKNVTADYLPDLQMTIIEAMNSITAEDWERFYSNIIKIENEYSRTDKAMEVEMDKFLVNLLYPESSGSTSDSESEVPRFVISDLQYHQ